MNRYVNICLITLFLFVKAFSQQSSKISFESGAVINNPLINGERLKSNGQSTTSTDWTYKYYTSAGYFLKFSYEHKLISKNKLTLLFPIGLSFMSQNTKYDRQGWSQGCFGGESANELKIVNHRNVNLFFGSTFQKEVNKFRYTGNIIFNSCFTINSKTHSIPYNFKDEYYNTNTQCGYNLFLSSQFCILYKIKNNIWVGPSCEIFYRNLSAIFNKIAYSQTFNENSGPSMNISGKNIWINPGIKLQLDLK